LTILFVLSGCAPGSIGLSTSRTPTVVSDFCRIAEPISYDSAHDTPETVKAIEAHNSKWACLCESDCPEGTK
jgi:hypothetical protein